MAGIYLEVYLFTLTNVEMLSRTAVTGLEALLPSTTPPLPRQPSNESGHKHVMLT